MSYNALDDIKCVSLLRREDSLRHASHTLLPNKIDQFAKTLLARVKML